MSRPLLDDAKRLAAQRTKIRADSMLISATHSHTAPASMGCLGTNADPAYVPFLREKLAQAIAAADANLAPARVGWAVANAESFTALRRWIRRPDRIADDPFGNPTVRANMHAARNLDDVTGPSGPEDPDLSLISMQATDGRPIAVLASFSMHYFGDQAVSADYFGLFCERFQTRLAACNEASRPPFVAIMAHGCSGDIWRRDYFQAARSPPDDDPTIESYTDGLLQLAWDAYARIEYQSEVDLANGGDGYIPPPEQHYLGGYNTWPARSAGLEVQAEPKITETALCLLERVADRPRREFQQPRGPACAALLKSGPMAYWRLDEFAGLRAVDISGHNRDAFCEPGVVFFLEGPHSLSFCGAGEQNRAAHFAGGRMRSRFAAIADHYSVSLWFWNGMPVSARETAGWIFSRGRDHGLDPRGVHLGIGGTRHPGKLIFLYGNAAGAPTLVSGHSEIPRWSWNHVVFVRDGQAVRVYLNGRPQPEIDTKAPLDLPVPFDELFFGGRCDNQSNWEGRLDEIAVFDRALSATEVAQLVD